MTREEARKAAQVMLAYADGAEVEYALRSRESSCAEYYAPLEPSFNWKELIFRVKQTPDFIDWSHVAPEYKWMARDKDGAAYVYREKPELGRREWGASGANHRIDTAFSSYKAGTVDWEGSLVSREEQEAEQ